MSHQIDSLLQIMKTLVRSEETVARFYSVCASAWPEHGDFWRLLILEEQRHAIQLGLMSERLRENPDRFKPGLLLDLAAIESFTVNVRHVAIQVLKGNLTPLKALITARDIERTLIEAKYAEVLHSSDPEYTRLVQGIELDTRRHHEMIIQRIGTVQTGNTKA
jgi:hypothetical protein